MDLASAKLLKWLKEQYKEKVKGIRLLWWYLLKLLRIIGIVILVFMVLLVVGAFSRG
jgi:hypothetical protein